MGKYEYKVVLRENIDKFLTGGSEEADEISRQQLEGWLNMYGEQGWHLAGSGGRAFIFMRRSKLNEGDTLQG